MDPCPRFGEVFCGSSVTAPAHRHAHGLTLGTLAERVGTSPTTLSRAERGLCALQPDLQRRLASALSLPEALDLQQPIRRSRPIVLERRASLSDQGARVSKTTPPARSAAIGGLAHVTDPLELFQRSPGMWSEADLLTLRRFDEAVMAGAVPRFRERGWRILVFALKSVLTPDPLYFDLQGRVETDIRRFLLELAREGLAELEGSSCASTEERLSVDEEG